MKTNYYTTEKNKELIIRIVFHDSKTKECWKFRMDIYKLNLEEIMICIEKQYNI